MRKKRRHSARGKVGTQVRDVGRGSLNSGDWATPWMSHASSGHANANFFFFFLFGRENATKREAKEHDDTTLIINAERHFSKTLRY